MPKWSAVVSGTPDAVEFGINADHRNMTKFPNADNEDFKKLSRTLDLMIQKSGPKVDANWALEACMKQGNQLCYSDAGHRLRIVIFYCVAQILFDSVNSARLKYEISIYNCKFFFYCHSNC